MGDLGVAQFPETSYRQERFGFEGRVSIGKSRRIRPLAWLVNPVGLPRIVDTLDTAGITEKTRQCFGEWKGRSKGRSKIDTGEQCACRGPDLGWECGHHRHGGHGAFDESRRWVDLEVA